MHLHFLKATYNTPFHGNSKWILCLCFRVYFDFTMHHGSLYCLLKPNLKMVKNILHYSYRLLMGYPRTASLKLPESADRFYTSLMTTATINTLTFHICQAGNWPITQNNMKMSWLVTTYFMSTIVVKTIEKQLRGNEKDIKQFIHRIIVPRTDFLSQRFLFFVWKYESSCTYAFIRNTFVRIKALQALRIY